MSNIPNDCDDDIWGNNKSSESIVHIRIQQRNGKKTITSIQGIDEKFDIKKILKVFKNEFACNGCVIDNDEYGEVIQLQGDQRNNASEFLIDVGICKKSQIKIHGF